MYSQNLVDFLFAEILECFALVIAWQGFDRTFNIFIYPNDPLKSMLCSLVISHSIYLFIAIIQSYVYRKVKKYRFIYRLVAEDLMHILMFISAVLAWKFYWMFAEYFFKTSATEFYLYVICHFASFLTALLLRVSAILVGPGNSFMDGQYPTDNIAYFEIEYLYFIFLVSFFLYFSIVSKCQDRNFLLRFSLISLIKEPH